MDEELELGNLDSPPADSLDGIFVLPEELANDPRILAWHTEMVRRLRNEAQGVPMKTAQFTLLERIAYFYAHMRYQELNNPNMTAREKMQYITAWQTMLDQFNRMLEKHNDKLMAETLLKVQEILTNRLALVSDPIDRASLRRALAEDFANLDL